MEPGPDEDERDRLPGEHVAEELARRHVPDRLIDRTLREMVGLSEMEAAEVLDRLRRRRPSSE